MYLGDPDDFAMVLQCNKYCYAVGGVSHWVLLQHSRVIIDVERANSYLVCRGRKSRI